MRVSIKKACEYSEGLKNKIDKILWEMEYGEYSEFYYYDIMELHKKADLSSEYVDEEIEVKPNKDILNVDCFEVLRIVENMIEEKIHIDNAILKAKKGISVYNKRIDNEVPIEEAIQYNEKKRDLLLYRLKELTGLTDEKFVREAKLKYEIEVEKTVKYCIHDAREYYKKLHKDLDELEDTINHKLTTEYLEFEPKYDIYDNIDRIIIDHLYDDYL